MPQRVINLGSAPLEIETTTGASEILRAGEQAELAVRFVRPLGPGAVAFEIAPATQAQGLRR